MFADTCQFPLRGEITPSALPDDNYPGGDSRQGTRTAPGSVGQVIREQRRSLVDAWINTNNTSGWKVKTSCPSPAAPLPQSTMKRRESCPAFLVYHSVVQDDLESLKFALSASNSLERGSGDGE